MTTPSPAYHSYLLRLWRTAEGHWRASLETVQGGERLAFASLAQLADYLALATEDPAPSQPTPARGPHEP